MFASLKQGKGATVTNELGFVQLPWKALDQISGGSISHEEGARILTALGLKQVPDSPECWLIPHRLDLTRPCDLLEEIVRVFGLDGIPSRFSGPFVAESPVDAAYNFQMELRRKLAALGFYETQTIKLIASESADGTIAQVKDALPLRPLQDGDLIRVSLPLSEDHSVLRPAHTPGLIAAAVRNSNQGVSGLRFFELGRVFRNTGGGKGRDIETDTLGILVSGDRTARSWADPRPEQASFEDLLAVMAALAPGHRFTLTPARPREQAALGADVQLDGKACGYFARLSLARCRELGLGQPVYVAELDLRKMQEILTAPVKAAELPQFPGSSRDAAMELPLSTPNADIVKAVESAREKLLVSYFCFDVFTDPSGEKLPADRKSIAYTFLYRDPAKTLTAAEVDAAHQRVLKAPDGQSEGPFLQVIPVNGPRVSWAGARGLLFIFHAFDFPAPRVPGRRPHPDDGGVVLFLRMGGGRGFYNVWGSRAGVAVRGGYGMRLRPPRKNGPYYGALPGGVPALLLAYYLFIPATNDKEWQPSWSRLPSVEINGNEIVVKDVRSFIYRTERDFDARYVTRRFDLDKLATLDFAVSHWDGMEFVAHTMLSFRF